MEYSRLTVTSVPAALFHWSCKSMTVATHRQDAELPESVLARLVGADEIPHPRHDLFTPLATVEDAVVADIRRLPVVEESGRLIGILTERDVFRLLLFWEGM